MPKTKTRFVCQQCGRVTLRMMGKCPQCGTFNSMVEEIVVEPPRAVAAHHNTFGGLRSAPKRLSEIEAEGSERWPLPIAEFSRVLGGGVVPGSLVLVGGDPGIGKCVTADTRLLDPATGDYLPITDWAGSRRPVVSVDTERHRLSSAAVSAFLPQGQQPIVQLRTRLGHALRCTPSHPVLTEFGWRPVEQLKPGDRLATPRALPFFGSEPMPEAEIKLIAHILSEGSTTSSISVTTSLPEVAADLREIAQAFGMRLVAYPKPNTKAVQYRFTNDVEQRRPARAELATAMRRVAA